MKKYISIVAIALMTLVVAFGSCKKNKDPEPQPTTPQYVKTEVKSTLFCSQDLIDFFDITYTIQNFQGEEVVMPLNDSLTKVFTTTEKNGTMKTIFNIAPKAVQPEIDTLRLYTFKLTGYAEIGALDSQNAYIDLASAKITRCPLASYTATIHGNNFNAQALAHINTRTFGTYSKTVTFTVTNGETVNAE